MTAAVKIRAAVRNRNTAKPQKLFYRRKTSLLTQLGFVGVILLCFVTVKIVPFLLSFG